MNKKYNIKNQNWEIKTFVYQISFFHHIDYSFFLNNVMYKNHKKSHYVKYSSNGVEKWKFTMENMLANHIKEVIEYLNNDLDLNKLEQEWQKEKYINPKEYLEWIVDNLK